MLTLKQLEARTTRERKIRAQYVKIVRMKTGHTPEGLGFVAAQTYSKWIVNRQGKLVPNPNKHYYISQITFINKKLKVHVSCSCDDNLYRWEYANSDKEAAVIEYSNGEMPSTTNPLLKAGLCKHLVALVTQIRPKLPSGY
jgi:hypothetical protein